MSEFAARINEMTFSFSRVHSFEGCRYEWYLNYLLKDENGKRLYENEQNFYAAFGHFCHEILEKILKDNLSILEAPIYYKEHFEEAVDCEVANNTRDKYFYLGLDYFESIDFDWLKEYEVLGIEKKTTFTIQGNKFIGYIDLLVKHKTTGKIIVIDHKSSEYPIGKKGKVFKRKIADYESYKKQLYLYSEQVFNEYGVYPDELWWNYFKEQQWLKLPFIKEEYESTKKWAVETIENMYKEENFVPNMDYFYCNNLCGYRNSCDYKLMGGE